MGAYQVVVIGEGWNLYLVHTGAIGVLPWYQLHLVRRVDCNDSVIGLDGLDGFESAKRKAFDQEKLKALLGITVLASL